MVPKTNHTVVTVQLLMFSLGCSRNQGAMACFLLKIRQTIGWCIFFEIPTLFSNRWVCPWWCKTMLNLTWGESSINFTFPPWTFLWWCLFLLSMTWAVSWPCTTIPSVIRILMLPSFSADCLNPQRLFTVVVFLDWILGLRLYARCCCGAWVAGK